MDTIRMSKGSDQWSLPHPLHAEQLENLLPRIIAVQHIFNGTPVVNVLSMRLQVLSGLIGYCYLRHDQHSFGD
jgi:hypothetical protein